MSTLMHSTGQYAFSKGNSLHPIPQSMEYMKKCKVNPSYPFSIQGLQVAALQHNDTQVSTLQYTRLQVVALQICERIQTRDLRYTMQQYLVATIVSKHKI